MKTGVDTLTEFEAWLNEQIDIVDRRRSTYRAGTRGAIENKAATATLTAVRNHARIMRRELEQEIPPFE